MRDLEVFLQTFINSVSSYNVTFVWINTDNIIFWFNYGFDIDKEP